MLSRCLVVLLMILGLLVFLALLLDTVADCLPAAPAPFRLRSAEAPPLDARALPGCWRGAWFGTPCRYVFGRDGFYAAQLGPGPTLWEGRWRVRGGLLLVEEWQVIDWPWHGEPMAWGVPLAALREGYRVRLERRECQCPAGSSICPKPSCPDGCTCSR